MRLFQLERPTLIYTHSGKKDEQFGAICTNQICDKVTRVVAKSSWTDEVNWAMTSGKFVVHPVWLEASDLQYRRENEADFKIKMIRRKQIVRIKGRRGRKSNLSVDARRQLVHRADDAMNYFLNSQT